MEGEDDFVDLGVIQLKPGQEPTYSQDGLVAKYHLVGYTLESLASELKFDTNSFVSSALFTTGETSMKIYSAWSPDYIVEFDAGGN